MSVCDICNRPLDFSAGYALTTSQVAGDENYWTYMLENHGFTDDLLLMYVQQQAMQVSGWLVCEACSGMFTFDRVSAGKYARRQQNPPGSGSLDINVAAAAAARAWRQKHGRNPAWLR